MSRRSLGTFGSFKVNNFFLFVALLMYGAFESGVPPRSAYPFLLLLGLLLLFPLSSDPLSRIPPDRLALWPLDTGSRVTLRLASLALSPVLWFALLLMIKAAPSLVLAFLTLVVAAQVAIAMAGRVARRPRWNPVRVVPALLRGMLTILDTYAAAALALAGGIYCRFTPNPDPAAATFLAMLVALALSTSTQSLFSLDGGPGATRYRLLPVRGWQILLAKDASHLAILFVLVLPLSPLPGLTFGLIALAIGHFPSVLSNIPLRRWRFAGGRVAIGAAQMLAGFTAGYGESQSGPIYFAAAAALCCLSAIWCGRIWEKRQARRPTPVGDDSE